MISGQAIKDQLSEGSGFWRSCSGCYETVDGYSGQVPDPTFRCELGTGCHECGGLGAVWDSTDYEDMAAFMIAEDRTDAENKRLRAALAEAQNWHQAQDKVLSKSGRGDAQYYYFRNEHQEQIDAITSALTPQDGGRA